MKQHSRLTSLTQIMLGVLALLILGTVVVWLAPAFHPTSGIPLNSNDRHIVARSLAVIEVMGLDPGHFRSSAVMTSDNALLARMYDRHGAEAGNRRLRALVPGHFWKVRLLRRDDALDPMRAPAAGDEARMVRRIMAGDISMRFDGYGRLLQLDAPLDDSVAVPSLSPAAAYRIVRRLLVQLAVPQDIAPLAVFASDADSLPADDRVIRVVTTSQQQRIDHHVRWTVYNDDVGDSIDVSATISGDMLARYERIPRFMRTEAGNPTMEIADIFEVVYYAIFGIILLVLFLRRMRSDEIGFRTAAILGTVIAILFGGWMYLELTRQMDPGLELLIPLLITPLFVGGGFVPLWAVGESLGRETWKNKLRTFDLLRAGYLLHSRVGRALLWGTVAGAAMLVVGLLASWAVDGIDAVWIRPSGNDGIRPLSMPSASLSIIGSALVSSLFAGAFMLLGIVSLARQRLRSTPLVIALPVLVFTLVNSPNLVPLPAAWLVLLPVMLLLVWLFVETDLLTALTALLLFSVLNDGLFLGLTPSAYMTDGMVIASMPALLMAWAAIALLTPDPEMDLESLAPRFQRHITERQRLARELEIARDVQMGFLPKRNPMIPGLDIASHCAPAQEVGGDYYDFVELGPHRLGIAIGDVSGKGTQAAFYMTLTKGFLQALAWQHGSPAAVLAEMNRLFYRNVERGHFISMIYAVFDMEARTLCIARAGHTPVMRRGANATVDSITSRGIALGFEAGDTFTATIEEIVVPLNSGEIYLLYTDGYPETMTRKREEYGDERLALALRAFPGGSAEQLLSHLYRDTRRFACRAEQHDDMTMVVVRVP